MSEDGICEDLLGLDIVNDATKPSPNSQTLTQLQEYSISSKDDQDSGFKFNQSKRATRKEMKVMKIISADLRCDITREPEEWVALWGPSLSMGTSKTVIAALFNPAPVEIRLYHNKMFCTMRFTDKSDACKARNLRNATEFVENQPMYLVFLKNEPPRESVDLLSPFLMPKPEGLQIITDFISECEESEIMKLIPEDLGNLGQSLRRRWVRHFGYDFDYGTNTVDPDKPSEFSEFPNCVKVVTERLVASKVVRRTPEQMTLNHYLPGQGIPPHVDTHSPFEEPIISLSLNSSVVIDFRDGDKHFSLILPRRSLLVMNTESRFQWTHGIANRTFDVVSSTDYGGLVDSMPRRIRVSLTFRLLRKSRICHCGYPLMCDSQKGKITAENAARLENSLVHRVYDDIALHFSSTRHTPWPKIKDFIMKLEPWESLLDVGCGNGKYLGLRQSYAEVGTDMSSGLLNICRTQKKVEGVKCNCLQLPFRNGTFDAVICIAVLHHLSTKERRLQALREILRVLKDEGEALIYVWAKSQEVENSESVYAQKTGRKKEGRQLGNADRRCVTSPDYLFLPVHDYDTNFSHNDTLVPWISGPGATEVYHRFYHVFDDNELLQLIRQLLPESSILESYYDQGNWCIHLRNHKI